MRLVVGYLATPSGEDGLALGIQLARTLGAQLDICIVLPPDRMLPGMVPTGGYEEILTEQAQQWLAAAASVPDGIEATSHISVTTTVSSASTPSRTPSARWRSRNPAEFPVTSTITDGPTVEDAVNKLDWYDGDLIMVGSSRLAQPRRLFLGSTAANMLRVLQVPMVVVPKEDAGGD